MSTLANILSTMKDIIEGETGSGRVVPKDRFRVMSAEKDLTPQFGVRAPFPAYIGVEEMHGALDEPSDLSGDYVHLTAQVNVLVLYGDKPRDTLDRFQKMADDGQVLLAALTWPNNWCIIDNWTGLEASFGVEPAFDDEGTQLGWLLTLACQVSYREKIG